MYNTQMFTCGTPVGSMVVIFSACVTTSKNLDNMKLVRDRSLFMTRGERGQATSYVKYFCALLSARRIKFAAYLTLCEKF